MSSRIAAGRVLRLRGLPFTATELEVSRFFSEYNVESVRLCVRQGKPTGEAWVRFENEGACSQALQHRNKQLLGKRYIELFRAKDHDLDAHPSEPAHSNRVGGIVRMRGLPFSACVREVVDFFKGVPALDPSRVYFGYDGTGRPSGEAYITFTTPEGFNAAMKLHKNKMGSRYIELFASSGSEVHRIAKQRKLRMDKGKGGTRVLVAPKDVEVKNTAPRMSAVRGQTQSGGGSSNQHSVAAQPSSHLPKATPRPLVHSFASIAASSPTTAVHAAAAAQADDTKPVSALSQHVEGLSLYQHDTRDFVQSYQGQISGAASGTSSAGTAGGHRGSKGEAGIGENSPDSPVWDAPTADGGWYNMWADHPMLPKLGLYESPSDGNMHDLNVWESQVHSGHMPTASASGM